MVKIQNKERHSYEGVFEGEAYLEICAKIWETDCSEDFSQEALEEYKERSGA